MNKEQLKSIIRNKVINKFKTQGTNKYSEYRMLNKVPALIPILEDLMSKDFSLFVRDIEWVSPKPPEYRVVLENDQYFYLADLGRSWVATVLGKRYYLLNLGEEQMATEAISRVLRYGPPVNPGLTEAGGSMESELEKGLEQPETSETEETPVGEIPSDLL